MSERYGREEEARRQAEKRQRLGPSIDTEGRRMDDPRGNGGPRPVAEVYTEREARGEPYSESREVRGQEGEQRRGNGDQDANAGRGTSWLSVILGWLAALGAGLILSGIVGAIVGAILRTGGSGSSATEGGAAGLVGLLITLLLAFIPLKE